MELKAYCKINLGLRVLRRRPDGFHDIETVMIPARELCDTVSVEAFADNAVFPDSGGIVDASSYLAGMPMPLPVATPRPFSPPDSFLEVSGPVKVDCPPQENICIKALHLLQSEYGIGQALIRLRKSVPTGAGLGGGSADAAAVLLAANREFVLELPGDELERLAARLGSDVAFFVRAADDVRGGAQLCMGRGEIMTPMEVDLDGLWLVIVKPAVAVSTAEAYAGVTPGDEGPSLSEILRRPVGEWRDTLRNDFEESVFARHPEIGALRRSLYDAGALYASMSGSGSAVYALFDRHPDGLKQRLGQPFFHVEQFR
jgi:4-diphosphocytidyl-2-C-methyl-D-erythritol kinase